MTLQKPLSQLIKGKIYTVPGRGEMIYYGKDLVSLSARRNRSGYGDVFIRVTNRKDPVVFLETRIPESKVLVEGDRVSLRGVGYSIYEERRVTVENDHWREYLSLLEGAESK